MPDAPRTWVLTRSPDIHAATAAHGFSLAAPLMNRTHVAGGVSA